YEEGSGLSKQDGWIQVKDQSIIVHDPVNGGKWPVISSLAPVKLKVNQAEVLTEMPVTSKDHIQWEIDEQRLYEITVSEDKLLAHFRLLSKERYAWRLVNTVPEAQIVLSAEEDTNILLESVHLRDVVAQLEQQ